MDLLDRCCGEWWGRSLLLITLLAAILRLVALDKQSIWYDEAYVIQIAESATAWELISGQRHDNGNPPLYFVLHKLAARVFGNSDAACRLLPAIFGIAAVPCMGLLGKRLFSPTCGLLAALLLATSPFHLEMSNETRVYSLANLICLIDVLLLLRWIDTPTWRAGCAYVLATTIACYAHYYIVFFMIAQLLMVLAQRDRALFMRWCLLIGVVAVLWLPWLPTLHAQLSTSGNLVRMEGSWRTQFLATPTVFGVGRTFAWRDASRVALGLAAAVAVLGFWLPALVGIVKAAAQRVGTRWLLVPWMLLPILIPLLVALAGMPVYHHRYGSIGLPAFLILVAAGLLVMPRLARLACVALIVAGTVYSLANFYTQSFKDNWRSATAMILDSEARGGVVLVDTDIEALPLLYHARRFGGPPTELHGIVEVGAAQELMAVRYEHGQQVDQVPRDYTSRILQAPLVTLGLCVPLQTAAKYEAFFAAHGYQLVERQTWQRVTVLRFKKQVAAR